MEFTTNGFGAKRCEATCAKRLNQTAIPITHSGGTMKVIIMRYLKVKYLWKKWYTSDEFEKECKEYDRSFVEHTE